MREELKPCPFCGKMPKIIDDGYTVVVCEFCQISGKAHLFLNDPNNKRIAAAAKSWNTRPIEAALTARHFSEFYGFLGDAFAFLQRLVGVNTLVGLLSLE